jgi:16S rRNA G966 N2-methylase RsmD
MNERITENLVRDKLRQLGYYSNKNDVLVEEQKSSILAVNRLLSKAGKAGKGGRGSPEFIIHSIADSDFLVVAECKPSTKFHASKNLNKPIHFAVDGALHYAKHLKESYNVIAIGISGDSTKSLRVSTYLWSKQADEYKIVTNESGKHLEELIEFSELTRLAAFDPNVVKKRHDDLMAFSRTLHEFMRDHAKLTESEKPLLVSGTLIALRNKAFAKSFGAYSPEALQKQWLRVIRDEMEKADIPYSKKEDMTQPYSSIAVHPALGKGNKKFPKGILFELITLLSDKVAPFINTYHDFDIVGQFYGEFLKYTGGDQKALGIVLTPRHVTELFALLANANKHSKVLDICAGTGGFLISAMHQMMKTAITTTEKNKIKAKGLVGVENQPNMFSLAASNMILRGDGKANLYQGSCFDLTEQIKKHRCDVGLLNPPYSQSDEDLYELKFVQHMLDCLVKGGIGIAIVPMSCAIQPHPMKQELLNEHTLEAVMSMPTELFYPVGVVTCVMVFTAKEPHNVSNRKTWFGYWKDDGFIKTKHLGRIDAHRTWPEIRDHWVHSYRNRDEVPGESVKQKVSALDEWCAEAYMETDYSKLSKHDFEKTVRDYAIFNLEND